MKVAELFVDLAVKGEGKAKEALTGVNTGLQGIVSSGLAGKAAILAVVYGVEQMAASAGKAGQGLENFNAATGLSIELLQKWQVAGLKTGTGAEEITGTVKNLQNLMQQINLGMANPVGFSKFAQAVGLDMQKALKDPFYMMERLQQYFKSGNPGELKQFTASMGLSDNMVSLFRRTNYDVAGTPANILSNRQAGQLANVDASLNKMFYDMKMFTNKSLANNGVKIIQDIGMVATNMLKAADALIRFADKMQVFDAIAKSLEGLIYILGGSAPKDNQFSKKVNSALNWRDQVEADIETFISKTFHSIVQKANPSSVTNEGSNTVINNFDIQSTDPQSSADEIQKILNSNYRAFSGQVS